MNLPGWVRNTSAGVEIEVDGQPEALSAFSEALQKESPPLARIDSFQLIERPPLGFTLFEIHHSESISGAFQPISPDVTICPDCQKELFDPADRRHRYPFINCTNCGPRFTIIEDIPYDRPLTTMAPFQMCADCAAEYENPLDRRFHAQPVACAACGPHVWLEDGGQPSAISDQLSSTGFRQSTPSVEEPDLNSKPPISQDAIQAARSLLRQGQILAIKGLGGFHLACDATNPEAVTELRRRKLRVDKPFALMMFDSTTVNRHCLVTMSEQALLESRERPIVVLKRRLESNIAADCAPDQDTLGAMLPYTPLHLLLLEPAPDFPEALVMTSGNLSEEPIATSNQEVRQRLSSLADAFLMHDRGIRTRCDDSVTRVFPAELHSSTSDGKNGRLNINNPESKMYFLRRSRGYAPDPVRLPWEATPLLATGPELKNTFCLTSGRYAFLSHHIGDMENYETLQAFEDGVEHFERLFRVRPEAITYDLHPNYLATRYALERAQKQSLPTFGVQHHHAHVAACMAEHQLDGTRPLIGVSFDGTGYGDDGAIWGGEFLVADYAGYQREYHLTYVPLPGGDKAVKEPWRMALAWLDHSGIPWDKDLPPVNHASGIADHLLRPLDIVRHQLSTGLNAPQTSSMGRLFDAVSALVGVRLAINYEAQAAIELETIADPAEEGTYPFEVGNGMIDARPMFRALVADLRSGVHASAISARFHNGIAHMVVDVCSLIKESHGLIEVALSGGVWQNLTLLDKTVSRLQKNSFRVYLHRQVPANDGGLALGQAAVAAYKLRTGDQSLVNGQRQIGQFPIPEFQSPKE
jgi:hydrogenase maturation protein HypF